MFVGHTLDKQLKSAVSLLRYTCVCFTCYYVGRSLTKDWAFYVTPLSLSFFFTSISGLSSAYLIRASFPQHITALSQVKDSRVFHKLGPCGKVCRKMRVFLGPPSPAGFLPPNNAGCRRTSEIFSSTAKIPN